MTVKDVRGKGQSLRARGRRGSPSHHASPTRRSGSSSSSGRQFLGVATKSGALVSGDILDQFTSKQSQQIKKHDAFGGISGLVEPLYNPDSLAQHMEANTYHARAVRTKAQDTAGQGWELAPIGENPSEEQADRVEELFESLDEDISEVLIQAMTDRESVGWLSIEIAREDKDPEGPVAFIKNIPSHTMRAHTDGKRFIQERSGRRVWFKAAGLTDIDVNKTTGEIADARELEEEDRANEVLWNNIYTSRSDVYGVPDHIPAVGAILGDIARRDYNITFFENFGVPAYAVFISGDYDPGEPEDDSGNTQEDIDGGATQDGDLKTPLHRDIELHLQSIADNPHSVLLLGVPSEEGGEVEIQFEKLAVDVKEASFRLYRMDNMKEVLSAHAVPPYRAGIAEQGQLGGNVASETDKIYRDGVLTPRQRMLERLINKHVLESLEVTDWHFDLIAIDVEDELQELEIALGLFDHAAMTPNDLIRAFGQRYGLEPIEGVDAMDAHYINGVAIDAVLTGDVEATMMGLRDNLLEIASKHAESGDGDGAFSAEFFETLASLKASAATAATNGGKTGSSTAAGNGHGHVRRAVKSRGAGSRTRRHRRNAAGYPSTSGGGG